MTPQKTLDEYMKKETQSTTKQQPVPHHEILEFYRETEFQGTPLGEIPREWRIVRLREVAEIRGSKKIPGSIKRVAFIPMEAIPDNGVFTGYEIRDVDEVKSYVYCEPGDILLAKITPSFENGKQGIVPEDIPVKFALATTEVYPIKCNSVDKLFLFYLLKYPPIRNKLVSLMRGTTGRRRVPREALEDTLLPYPSIREQRGISQILSTIDEAIEGVDESVARLERLKRALMRELLTGRVRVREENGKLVFHRETEFQETEIGKIPREWKVVRFKEVAEIRKGKRIPERVESVAFIPMEAIPDNGLYAKYELRNVNEVKSYVYCEPGDILLAKITPSFENGKQGIVPEELQGKIVLATTEVYPISCKNIDKYFLFYLLKYPPIRNKLTSLMRGTTGRKRVPREALEELLLPYPPITEQQKIAEILSTIDKAIELYYEKKMRFKRLKRGLMDLLLTGKVRVRVKPAS